ncbi:MAG: hypothetical protein HC922_05790 [Leptolyngbyaceae cyanobacterium SM2_3_12]|nr:hypothetical protein [Leptolyngbyaceae cyanobacterium SM2_3_12]
MTLQRILLTTTAASLLLGSLGLAVFNRVSPALAQGQPGQESEQFGGRQGRPGRGDRLAAAAEQLGVTEAALKTALGLPAERPQPDFAAAATQLGTTEAELRTALQDSRQGEGRRGGRPDWEAVAAQYGVSEAELKTALGLPAERPQPNLAAAAAQLGVNETDLRNALQGDCQRGNR